MRDFSSDHFPQDLITARHMLQEHLTRYKAVEDLFAYTFTNGKDALASTGEDESFGIPREEIRKLIGETQEKHEEWSSLWEAHKKRLAESVNVCQFEQDINQVDRNIINTRFYKPVI